MTTCPSCGIAGNNFICPNHISCSGVNPNLDLVPPPQTIVNWINSNSAQLFAEIGRLNILLNERDKEIERLKGLMPADERGPGFVGQGSWSMFAEKVVAERDALRDILADLRKKGVIDGLNRPLPLEGHHKDCGHGKDGWSLCTCDAFRNRDARNQRNLDRIFDDLVEEDKVTCDHGNTECKRCGVGQPAATIKTPEGKPLLPAAEFAAMQIEENKELGLAECNFQRRTGRTTAMVLEALEFVKDSRGRVNVEVHNPAMKKRVKELLKHYADELGVRHDQLSLIRVRAPGEYSPSAALNLYDNVIDDMKETKPTRDPRQDLKVGQHVRFEIEGFIKERQSGGIFQDEDGSDFEPIQYAVKDSINGMTYYVGYHKIIKVIGKEK